MNEFLFTFGLIAVPSALLFSIIKIISDRWLKRFFRELAGLLNFIPVENFRITNEFSEINKTAGESSGSEYYTEIYWEKLYMGNTRLKTIAIELKLDGKHDRNFVIEYEKLIVHTDSGDEKKRADIQMNDYSFDDAALLTGTSTAKVRALLHPEVRRRITEFLRNDSVRYVEYKADRLKINMLYMSNLTPEYLASFYHYLFPFVKLLSREGTTEELLRRNYLAEKYQSVKIKYLESLRPVGGKLSEDDEVIRDALGSGNPRLMLEAVINAGVSTHKYIPEIFRKAAETMRIRVLDFLLRCHSTSEMDYFLDKHSWMETIDGKLKMLEYYISIAGEKSADSVRAMIENHDSRNDDYHRRCIRALGSCGNYGSIYFLKKQKNIFNARAVDQAIAEIQSRIGTGDEGWLSIDKTENDEGKLSLEKE